MSHCHSSHVMESGRPVAVSGRSRAFSLTEMLVVMAIIGMLAAIMGPSLNSAVRGTALTQGADKVIGVLKLARQIAVTRNQTVEVRFYNYIDPESPGDRGGCHALQAFTVNDAGNVYTPITKFQTLPSAVVVTTNPTFSSLLATNKTAGVIPIPRVRRQYTYNSFQFYRSGATSLIPQTGESAAGDWFVTVLNARDDVPGSSKPPPNFTTIVINPHTGVLTTYRPTL